MLVQIEQKLRSSIDKVPRTICKNAFDNGQLRDNWHRRKLQKYIFFF